ncbi:hypothetical protein PanWU01x14_071590 [Parasponia andersonii]|uniref:Transmembrane protein n=1 Tax=Parasponia andersonii TaxID=3476 RepID=A0A2P5DEJ0_PARAD|nr:hypothetical protein PanWU01x14_071590 [Parasponia andersonii]
MNGIPLIFAKIGGFLIFIEVQHALVFIEIWWVFDLCRDRQTFDRRQDLTGVMEAKPSFMVVIYIVKERVIEYVRGKKKWR